MVFTINRGLLSWALRFGLISLLSIREDSEAEVVILIRKVSQRDEY